MVFGKSPTPSFILKGITMSVFKSLKSALETLENSQHPAVEELLKIYEDRYKTEESIVDNEGKAPFIVLEGLDGSGKTTVGKYLAKKLKGSRQGTPPPSIMHLRSSFDSEPTPTRRAFYALGNYLAAEEVKKMVNQNTPVVMDRFWHSTAAYALGHEVDSDTNYLPPAGNDIYTWPEDLLKPDIVFYLSVDEAARVSRTARRSVITEEEEELAKNQRFRTVIDTAYQRMVNPGVTIIDANNPLKKVINNCLTIVLDHFPTFKH